MLPMILPNSSVVYGILPASFRFPLNDEMRVLLIRTVKPPQLYRTFTEAHHTKG